MFAKVSGKIILPYIVFIFSLGYFTFQLVKNIDIIGTIDDEIYNKSKNRIVGIVKYKGEYKELFNEYENSPNNAYVKNLGFAKLISQSLPPISSIAIGDKTFPLLIWFHAGFPPYTIQNLFLHIKYTVISARIPCVLLAYLLVFVIFLIFKELGFKTPSILFGISFFMVSASFIIFSVQSASFPYMFCNLLFVIFILLSIKDRFVLSSIAAGLIILSYFKFGANLVLPYILITLFSTQDIRTTLKKISIFSLTLLLFASPYIIHSLVFYELDKNLPRPGGNSFFSFFPRTPITFIIQYAQRFDIIQGIKNGLIDIAEIIGKVGYGTHLTVNYSYSSSKFFLIPIFLFTLCFFEKRLISLLAIVILYILCESITFTAHGFPRRFIIVLPIIISTLGVISWEYRKKIFGLILITFMIAYAYTQIKELNKFIGKLKKEGIALQYTHMEVQEELKKFLIENNIKEISNFSALINLDIISEGKVNVYDWSYAILWGAIKFNPAIFQVNEGRYILFSWIKPHDEIEKIARMYKFKLRKIKSFSRGNNEIFTISKIERENQ